MSSRILTSSTPNPAARALSALWRAAVYAGDARIDRWELAIELDDLLSAGLSLTDLRWLLHRGYARHAEEVTPAGSPCRQFRSLAITELPANTCVTLTPEGESALAGLFEGGGVTAPFPNTGSARESAVDRDFEAQLRFRLPAASPGGPLDVACDVPTARRQLRDGARLPNPAVIGPPAAAVGPDPQRCETESLVSPPLQTELPQREAPLVSAAAKPVWDMQCRELRYAGQTVKRFRVPAENQELVLNVFQEEGWPQVIDDPLPQLPLMEPMRRLQATIRSLNRNRIAPVLRFFGNGCGNVVCWEPRR